MEYLAEHHIRELFTKLTYDLSYHRPVDSISFIIDRLSEYRHERFADPSVRPMQIDDPERLRIMLVVGQDESQCETYAEQLCSQYEMYHVSVSTLVQREIDSGSEQGQMIQQCRTNGQEPNQELLFELVKQEIQALAVGTVDNDSRADSAHNRKLTKSEMTYVITGAVHNIRHALDFQRVIAEPREVHFLGTSSQETNALLPVIQYFAAQDKLQHCN